MKDETIELVLDASEFKKKKPVKHRQSYYGIIYEYDLCGTFIRSWESAAEAAEHYGITSPSIYSCLIESRPCVQKIGRIFLYEGGCIEDRLALLNTRAEYPNKKAYKVPVDEFDLNGKLLHSYSSITEAAESTEKVNSTIRKCCKGKPLSIKSRIYLFHGDSIEARLEQIQQQELSEEMKKSVNAYTLKGELMQAFTSPVEAAEKYGISPIKIVWCCIGKISFYDRKIFLFSSDNINNRIKKK